MPDDLGPSMRALLQALLSGSDEERAAHLAQEVAETNRDPVTQREAIEQELAQEHLSEAGSKLGGHDP